MGYVAGLNQAAVATRGAAAEMGKAAAANKQFTRDVSRGALVGGAALLGMAGAAVMTAADFDKAMSGVQAATHETAANMELLRAAAIKAGADTAFSAMEAADGMTALAKAGVSTKDVLSGGLRGALDLAAAGQVSVGDAADTAATAMTQFNLKGAAVPHIADLLAAAAGKAQGSVGDMSAALKQSGLVASQMGLSIEDTTGTLSAFASAGLIGSDAGTSLRTMLLRLANPSNEAAKTMSDLGIAAYDAQGQFVGIESIAGQLQTAFQGQTQATKDAALATIFGSDAIRGANVLYTQGAAGIQKWNDKVNDQGYAAKTAAIQLDNLRGDIEKLTGSLQSALIGSGSGANGALRGITQGATGAVNAFGELPGAVQGGATVLSAVGGTALIAAGAFGTMAPKVRETRKALLEMGAAGQFANRSISFLGKAGLAAGSVLILAEAVSVLDRRIDHWAGLSEDVDLLSVSLAKFASTGQVGGSAAKALGGDFGELEAAFKEVEKGRSTFQSILRAPIKLTDMFIPGSMDSLRDAKERIDEVDKALAHLAATGQGAAAAGALEQMVSALGLTGQAAKDFRAQFDDYKAALEAGGPAAAAAAQGAVDVGDGLGAVTPEARAAAEALDNYKIALDDMTAIDAYTANAQLAQSFRELAKSMRDGGKVTNEEKVSLGGFAKDVKGAASAVFEASGNQDKANATMARGRSHFIKLAEAAGYSAGEARKLANRLGLIPPKKETKVTTPGMDPAIGRAGTYLDFLNAIPHNLTTTVTTRFLEIGKGYKVPSATPGRSSGVSTNKEGGYISGPGTWTSDSIPALLSNGEYVVKAAAVAKYGTHFFDMANAMGYADGGDVPTKAESKAAAKAAAKKAAEARAQNRAATSARSTARATSAIVARTPVTDSVAEIEEAIAAVERLTDAYADQQAMVGMNAAERRKYLAEHKSAANADLLATRKSRAEDRAAAKAKADEEAREHAATLVNNRQEWEFSHLTMEQQAADLAARIGAEEQYSDKWLSLMNQREQIVEQMRQTDEAAAMARAAAAEERRRAMEDDIRASATVVAEAIKARNAYAGGIAGSITSFGSVTSGTASASGIARSMSQRVAIAREYVANIRTLRAAGLNEASIQDILSKGVDGGAAYAKALVKAGLPSILSVNQSQAQLNTLGNDFGADVAGGFYNAGIAAKRGLLDGMLADTGELAGAMRTFADQLISSLTTELDIHSPSRRMAREVGVHIPGGVLMGVKQGEPALRAYMNKMVDPPVYASTRISGGASMDARLDVGKLELQLRRANDLLERSLDEHRTVSKVLTTTPAPRAVVSV
jgi:TP901 family phage tail tape measure protein